MAGQMSHVMSLSLSSALLSPQYLFLRLIFLSLGSSAQIRDAPTLEERPENGRCGKKAHVQLNAESPIPLPFFHPPLPPPLNAIAHHSL